MKNKKYIIVDLGAESGRVMRADYDLRSLKTEEVYRFKNTPVEAAGTLYWDILRIFSDIKNGIQSACRQGNDIISLAVDSWAVDFAFIDKNGKLIANPVHYRDIARNSNANSKRLYAAIEKSEIFKIAGSLFAPSSIYNMFMLKEMGATEIEKAYKFLMIPDLINYFLTGQVLNEFTNVTSTAFFDQGAKKWSNKILGVLGIEKEIFAELAYPAQKTGEISDRIASELLINKINVVFPASWDNSSAVAGTPCTHSGLLGSQGSLGTWSTIGIETEEPLITEDVFRSGFINSGSLEGKNLLIKAFTGLWIIQSCRNKWIKDMGREITWPEIVGLAEKSQSFKAFINVEDPVFSKYSADMVKIIDDTLKKTGQELPEDIGHYARCIFESMAMGYRYNIDILNRISKKRIGVLHLVGGGIKNNSLCQWISDSTGLPVKTGPTESTSYGNLIAQLIADQEISSLEEGRELVGSSIEMNGFEPRDHRRYDEAYLDRYLKILKKDEG